MGRKHREEIEAPVDDDAIGDLTGVDETGDNGQGFVEEEVADEEVSDEEVSDEEVSDEEPGNEDASDGEFGASIGVDEIDEYEDSDLDLKVVDEAMSHKDQNARALAIRRAIEERLEAKRLSRNLDYLDLDVDD